MNHSDEKPPSERAFAAVFSAFFLLVALAPLLHHRPARLWSLPLAAAFSLVGWISPRILRVPNLLWFRLGILLSKVTQPLVMGAIFFLVITPFGFFWRRFGKNPLRLAWEPELKTYWINREPAGPSPESMKHLF